MAHWKPGRWGTNLRAALAAIGLHVHVTSDSRMRSHAIVPLALFEAIRLLDLPTDDGLGEFHHEFEAKRLGTNRTVAAQIARYAALARSGKRVDGEEVTALLRLVGRRADAGLVYAEAGRRAGRMAATDVSGMLRLARRVVPLKREAVGLALARRAAAEVFAIQVASETDAVVATKEDDVAIHATPNGAACIFFGSGVAELLRIFTNFDGALLHVSCRGRGDHDCRWRTGVSTEE
jgi:hypothetical protein